MPPEIKPLVEVVVCGIAVFLGGLQVYGLKREWRWLIDPPGWLFAFYFPAAVKILHGPKYVQGSAYLVAWSTLAVGLYCFVPALVGLMLSRWQ